VRDFERSLSHDMLDGALAFRGNTAELEGRDLRPALATSLGTYVKQIYTRLEDFAAPVNRRDAATLLRSDDLSGLPNYLGAGGLGIVTVDAEGHRIDDERPVGEFVKAVRDQVNYGSEPTGKYLEGHFAKPPYGADLDIVMILAAAAVRAGLVKVAQGGQWLSARSDARLEQVFATVPKFRSAAFRTREDLDITVRTRVARLLQHDLVGEKPGLATEELAEFARSRLGKDRHDIIELSATLRGLDLRLPDSVAQAQATLQRMDTEDDETLVQSLDAARNDLRDGIDVARKLHAYLDDDRLDVLRRSRQVLSTAADELPAAARAAHETGNEILKGASYVERFAELRGALETIEAERRTAWESAREALNETLDAVRAQMAPLLPQVSEAVQERVREQLDTALPDSASFETGPSRETLLLRASQLNALVGDLRAEIAREPDTVTRRVSVRELHAEPVRTEQELETLLQRIRTAGEEALAADEHFLLT
jgi:hypothetical protein